MQIELALRIDGHARKEIAQGCLCNFQTRHCTRVHPQLKPAQTQGLGVQQRLSVRSVQRPEVVNREMTPRIQAQPRIGHGQIQAA